jgi:hypothetical protein
MIRLVWLAGVMFAVLAAASLAQEVGPGGQVPPPAPESDLLLDQTSDEMTDLEKLSEKLEKTKKKLEKPPFEFMRSQVAPMDVLPLVKPFHWATLSVELRANNEAFDGVLQTATEANGRPQLPLPEMPRAMVYSRDALLPADQTVKRSLQLFASRLERNNERVVMELARPNRLRADIGFEASLQRLLPHQMLIAILSAEPDAYKPWTKMQATLPSTGNHEPNMIDRVTYYRLVMPLEPARPNLSPHPLTWTSISHVVWDDFAAENLSQGSFSQQQALLDWLHWGGQLIIVATGPSVAGLEQSFLGPYLPARYTGRSEVLADDELQLLAETYLPPMWGGDLVEWVHPLDANMPMGTTPPKYKPAVPITPAPGQPIHVSVLEPIEGVGAREILIGEGKHALGVERRVGRGRILMLTFNPNDPALVQWQGMDSVVRRVILRRPEEKWTFGQATRGYVPLEGPDVSSVRLLARDLGARQMPGEVDPDDMSMPGDLPYSRQPTAAWIDVAADLPVQARDTLEQASGISIPGNGFVLRVVLAYIVALVPLNWLLCRFVLRRRELAWVIAPVLSFAFAYGVERAAARDVGFDIACDELDVVELFGESPRAHVSRFASLYSSGRVDFRIEDPGNPTSLTLPMKSYQSLRGEAIQFSSFQSTPETALADFMVQPRSMQMFRSESIVDLGGGIVLEGGIDGGRVVNGTDLELWDAVLIDVDTERRIPLGRIAAWPREGGGEAGPHRIELGRVAREVESAPSSPASEERWLDLPGYLERLAAYRWPQAENRGEVRLVAWARAVQPGQTIAPRVDRHRGLRLVVAHLRFANTDPGAAAYVSSNVTPEAKDPELPNELPLQVE